MVDLPDCRAQLRMMRLSVEVRRSRCQGSGAMPNDLANATGSCGILVSARGVAGTREFRVS